MSNLNEAIDVIYSYVKNRIDDSWSVLEKTRYIYLTIGKFLEKNTDFFLNEKLAELKLGQKEINNIYENDDVNKRETFFGPQYQIICKSAAVIQKEVLAKFGIYAEYVQTCGDKDEIRHWFLVVPDGANNYFLTLAADLPYIKNNYPTHHFASSISLFRTSTVTKEDDLNIKEYAVVESNGNCFAIKINDIKDIIFSTKDYRIRFLVPADLEKGIELVTKSYNVPKNVDTKTTTKTVNGIDIIYNEINYTNLNVSGNDTLKEIDKKIGFGNLYESDDYLTTISLKELYYVLKEENSIIYRIFNKCLHLEKDLAKSIDDITDVEVKNLCSSYNEYLAGFLNNYYNTTEFDSNNFLVKFVQMNDGDASIDAIPKSMKKIKKDNKGTPLEELISNILSIVHIENMFTDFITLKQEIKTLDNSIKQRVSNYQKGAIVDKQFEERIYADSYKLFELEKKFDKVKKQLSISELNPMLNRIAYYFVNHDKDEIAIVDDDFKGFVSQKYIYDKFCLLVPIMLDINYNNNQTVDNTKFSCQNYSEQIVIIKDLLRNVFMELRPDHCFADTYNDSYSPIENRIRVFPMKDRQTGEYAIGFRFYANEDEDEVSLIYIPSKNRLREMDVLQDNNKYLIVSNSLSKIDNLENIEDKKK